MPACGPDQCEERLNGTPQAGLTWQEGPRWRARARPSWRRLTRPKGTAAVTHRTLRRTPAGTGVEEIPDGIKIAGLQGGPYSSGERGRLFRGAGIVWHERSPSCAAGRSSVDAPGTCAGQPSRARGTPLVRRPRPAIVTRRESPTNLELRDRRLFSASSWVDAGRWRAHVSRFCALPSAVRARPRAWLDGLRRRGLPPRRLRVGPPGARPRVRGTVCVARGFLPGDEVLGAGGGIGARRPAECLRQSG